MKMMPDQQASEGIVPTVGLPQSLFGWPCLCCISSACGLGALTFPNKDIVFTEAQINVPWGNHLI
jgi:hypothetical protein